MKWLLDAITTLFWLVVILAAYISIFVVGELIGYWIPLWMGWFN